MDGNEEIVLRLPRYGFGRLSIKWFIEEYMYQRSKTSEPYACISDIHAACKLFYKRMSKKPPIYLSVWRICREMRDTGVLVDVEPAGYVEEDANIRKKYVALSEKRITELDKTHKQDGDVKDV